MSSWPQPFKPVAAHLASSQAGLGYVDGGKEALYERGCQRHLLSLVCKAAQHHLHGCKAGCLGSVLLLIMAGPTVQAESWAVETLLLAPQH